MELTTAQQEMASHHSGPMMAIAVAGSGKTTAIIENLRNKNIQGIKLSEAIVTAFNKDAAEQLKLKVKAFYPNAYSMMMGTSHAIFNKVLRDCQYPIKGIFRDWQAKEVIQTALRDQYEPGTDAKVYGAIGYLKNCLAFPKPIEHTNCFERYEDLETVVAAGIDVEPSDLRAAYLSYEHAKNHIGEIDMDDMLFLAYVVFKQRPKILEYYQNRYKHLVVDEYQDTNEVQYQLFKMLAEKHNNIIVVGDDDQAIYGFRGSNPLFMQNFREDYPDAKIIRMDHNFRSQSDIVVVANKVISQNKDRLDKSIVATIDSHVRPQFMSFETKESEAEWIADSIIENKLLFHNYCNVAILTRTNAQQAVIEQVFAEKKVPYDTADGNSFFLRKEVLVIMAYLGIVLDKGLDIENVKLIANKPNRYVKNIDMAEWKTIDDIRNVSLTRSLRRITDEFNEDSSAEDFIQSLEDSMNLKSFMEDSASLNVDQRPGTIFDKMLSMSAGLTIKEFYQKITETQEFYKMPSSDGRVKISTVHKAKGLEWGYVYIPGCSSEMYPHKSSYDTEEERRLFYVAITRAKSRLFITNGGEDLISPFVRHLFDNENRVLDYIQGL